MRLNKITALHYIKLGFRLAVFIAAIVSYAAEGAGFFRAAVPWMIVGCVFIAEMLIKQFPLGFESMGNQKQFAKNYISTYMPKAKTSGNRTAVVAVSWIALNLAIGVLRITGIIDEGVLVLISMGYAVCDMICVLFFCPFQKWIMKNRCCVTCRIYNWDYAMIFTPLVFVKSAFGLCLVLMSLMILARWEMTVRRHPERFSESTNDGLSCAYCKEKRCRRRQNQQVRKYDYDIS